MKAGEIILQQLGGRRFIAMTGARDFVGNDTMLMFRLPRAGKDGGNKVRITLDASDTYTVETFYVRSATCVLKSSRSDVYNDQLTSVFTSLTGYATRL